MSELVQQLIQDGQDLESIKKALQLQIPGIDTNYCIGEALRNAIFRGNEAFVRRMLDVGVSPETRDQYDPLFTPLFVAAQYGRLEIATWLWEL
jgi:hypothetical protein